MASTTEEVMKSRIKSNAAIKAGKWCEDFEKAKKFADKNKMPILAVWSNGDLCGHCVNFNKCILDKTFTKWQKDSGVVFWIGYGSDTYAPNRHGGEGYKFAKNGNLTNFPFVRLYWRAGNVDVAKSGDEWDGASASGAATLVKNLKTYLKKYDPSSCPGCDDDAPADDSTNYKVRFNESLTVKKVNAILDAIDKNGGYCPCQEGKTSATKCQCKDFRTKKKIGEPCICNLYVKHKK